jgi:hypothetical protein
MGVVEGYSVMKIETYIKHIGDTELICVSKHGIGTIEADYCTQSKLEVEFRSEKVGYLGAVYLPPAKVLEVLARFAREDSIVEPFEFEQLYNRLNKTYNKYRE